MIPPEILHILFTVGGLALGWYIKHQSIKIPPEVLAVVEQLLAEELHGQTRDRLQALLAPDAPPPAPTPTPAKT
jgi:hypothetical protein